jgi:hypothetical protein
MTLRNVNEDDVPLRKRSYLWYAINKPELLGAKIAATRWLLKSITGVKTAREYMAGIGIQSLCVRERFPRVRLNSSDVSVECVAHLGRLGIPAKVLDARKEMLLYDDSDLKLVDFPASSILHVNRGKWRDQFYAMFEGRPRAVIWTDTSISYHIAVHGARYAHALGVKRLTSTEDYVRAYSGWLDDQFGYTIARAAVRGHNALYLCAMPERYETEIKTFALNDHLGEFQCRIIG